MSAIENAYCLLDEVFLYFITKIMSMEYLSFEEMLIKSAQLSVSGETANIFEVYLPGIWILKTRFQIIINCPVRESNPSLLFSTHQFCPYHSRPTKHFFLKNLILNRCYTTFKFNCSLLLSTLHQMPSGRWNNVVGLIFYSVELFCGKLKTTSWSRLSLHLFCMNIHPSRPF